MRRALPIVALAVAAVAVSSSAAAPGMPFLRSASASHRHVVALFTIGDLRAEAIEVATSPARTDSGAFVAANVRDVESVTATANPATGLVRWRTHRALPARVYYVEVSGVETDGVTDCLPIRVPCLVHWSNVRRVVVH